MRILINFILLSLIIKCITINALKWLSILHTSSLSTTTEINQCDSIGGLNKKQIQICKRNMELMGAIRHGAESAILECQKQFSTKRWNCSSMRLDRMFGKMVNEGTKEAAFVHAITSAGVAHAVTRACSSGQLMKCGCDRTNYGQAVGFQWSGCSDNIAFGSVFARIFIDARDLRAARSRKPSMNSARALMNLHNNEAGRKVLIENMRKECKCHGVSGSCELKTCWRALPSIESVGHILKEKFETATEVQLNHIESGKPGSLKPKGPKITKKIAQHSKRSRKMQQQQQTSNINTKEKTTNIENDLVYLHASPDYCEPDDKYGSLGTHNRLCNRTSTDADNCDVLCCGRGYRTTVELIKERCNCKFYWCCNVECEECTRKTKINICL